MSRSSKPVSLRASAGILALLAAFGASAEAVDKRTSARKTTPTTVESMARIPDHGAGSVLKCWQEGRLIFESNGVSFTEGLSGAAALKGPNGRVLQLLDLRQGLCILERTSG